MSDELKADQEFSVKSGFRFAMVPHWLLEMNLSSGAVHMYALLMYHANSETRECYPSHKRLGDLAGCSVTTVKKYLKELKVCGAIEWKGRAEQGWKTSNLYYLPQEPAFTEVNSEPIYLTEDQLVQDEPIDLDGSFDIELEPTEDSGFDIPADVKKRQSKDPYFAVMADCLGYFPKVKGEYALWNKCINQIKLFTSNPEDIRMAVNNYPKFMPKGTTMTINAITKHFQSLVTMSHDDELDALNKLEEMKTKNQPQVVDVEVVEG
tara:strand:- start:6560 stop:7351 length:792 start_codon:yes stop_codon:yes gene_type:complete